LLFIIIFTQNVLAQQACTDPLANNYDSNATESDGSCTYDAQVLTYETNAPDEFLIGTGIGNANMAVGTNSGLSTSMKAIIRFFGDVPATDGLYRFETGTSPVSNSDPTPDPGIARWGFLFSVNLGAYTASDVQVLLDVDFDPAEAPGTVFTSDLSAYLH